MVQLTTMDALPRMKLLLPIALLLATGTASAAIPTPERPITDPKSLTSPVNADAGPVPIADITFSRGYSDAAWSADGKSVFVTTNLTGRYNLWRTDAAGSWPVQDKDPALYKAQSPMTYLANARAPLLSLQGENDIRVPRGQAKEVEDLLKSRGVATETMFYPGEGHGFQKRETQTDALTRTVAWFDRYLKGVDSK